MLLLNSTLKTTRKIRAVAEGYISKTQQEENSFGWMALEILVNKAKTALEDATGEKIVLKTIEIDGKKVKRYFYDK